MSDVFGIVFESLAFGLAVAGIMLIALYAIGRFAIYQIDKRAGFYEGRFTDDLVQERQDLLDRFWNDALLGVASISTASCCFGISVLIRQCAP